MPRSDKDPPLNHTRRHRSGVNMRHTKIHGSRGKPSRGTLVRSRQCPTKGARQSKKTQDGSGRKQSLDEKIKSIEGKPKAKKTPTTTTQHAMLQKWLANPKNQFDYEITPTAGQMLVKEASNGRLLLMTLWKHGIFSYDFASTGRVLWNLLKQRKGDAEVTILGWVGQEAKELQPFIEGLQSELTKNVKPKQKKGKDAIVGNSKIEADDAIKAFNAMEPGDILLSVVGDNKWWGVTKSADAIPTFSPIKNEYLKQISERVNFIGILDPLGWEKMKTERKNLTRKQSEEVQRRINAVIAKRRK